MLVPMVMWLVVVPVEFVGMLVVLVMNMLVAMLHRIMLMFVLMVLRQVQPDAPGH